MEEEAEEKRHQVGQRLAKPATVGARNRVEGLGDREGISKKFLIKTLNQIGQCEKPRYSYYGSKFSRKPCNFYREVPIPKYAIK